MINFDELSLEEKIKVINESSAKLADALKPIADNLVKMFRDFGRAVSLAMGGMSAEEFKRLYMTEAKKERHRKRYYRMMSRSKKY